MTRSSEYSYQFIFYYFTLEVLFSIYIYVLCYSSSYYSIYDYSNITKAVVTVSLDLCIHYKIKLFNTKRDIVSN